MTAIWQLPYPSKIATFLLKKSAEEVTQTGL